MASVRQVKKATQRKAEKRAVKAVEASKVALEKAVKAEAKKDPSWKGGEGKRGDFETAKVQQQQRDSTVGPAVTRALTAIATQLELGGDAQSVVMEAAREFAGSPEAMAAFKQALPFLEKNAVDLGNKSGAPLVGQVAAGALPLLASGENVKAVLKVAGDVAGPEGRRLVGAALRGLNSGKGVAGATAEVAATAAKMGAKWGALGSFGKGLAQALPVLGNAMNLMSLGSSLKGIYDAVRGGGSAGQILARCLHLGATVTGCFIPPAAHAATAIDVASAFTRKA